MSNTSRRSFLNSMAILSAGTALASIPGFLQPPGEIAASDLQQLWRSFCKRNGGKNTGSNSSLMEAALPPPCKGHQYKTGTPVYFAGQGLVAIPVWVFWTHHSEKPADLLITFFKNSTQPEKITRINRFELEAITGWQEANKQTDILSPNPGTDGKIFTGISKTMKIKTRISKDLHADTFASICNETLSFKKSLIYNI
jgi:hypothetical protein